MHPIRDIHLVAATLASGMLAARPDQGAEAAAKYYFQILDALQNKAEFPSGVPAPRFSGQGHAPDTPGSWPAGPRSPEPRQQQSVGSSGARQVWP